MLTYLRLIDSPIPKVCCRCPHTLFVWFPVLKDNQIVNDVSSMYHLYVLFHHNLIEMDIIHQIPNKCANKHNQTNKRKGKQLQPIIFRYLPTVGQLMLASILIAEVDVLNVCEDSDTLDDGTNEVKGSDDI